jgi:hypothetical protein
MASSQERPPGRKLRFAVMAHADGLADFAVRAVESIRDLAEPVLVILDEAPPRRSGVWDKLRKAVRLRGNLWHIQSRLFPPQAIPAYRKRPIAECFPDVPVLRCAVTRKGKWSEYFSREDIARIAAWELDFVLKFGYGIIRGDIFSVARYGIWSYHHDDEQKYRGGPPAFWEICRGDPVTGAMLQRINDVLDGGVVLKKVFVPTAATSYRKNLQRILEASVPMVRWVCLDILHGRVEHLEGPPSGSKAPIFRAPNDGQMLRFWLRLAANRIRERLDNQRVDEWNVGLVRMPPQRFLDETFEPNVEWSPYRERHQMVADPFLVPDRDRIRLLCEEFDWFSESGRILEMRADRDGRLCRGTPAIDEPAHMSYPYVFQAEGQTYCIPECAERREIPLYRWDEDAGRWRRDGTLLAGLAALDATVFEAFGAWWLLHSLNEGAGPWSLYVWRADHFRGPWTPHPANPVKIDAGSARPAGQPFWCEGRLYRPAQDCRTCYGGALVIHRIEELSLEAFRETPVRRIEPNPAWRYRHGLHTLNGLGELTVIDAKRHCWPPGLILKRFLAKKLGRPRRRAFRYRSGEFRVDLPY